jgi:hypothetical protein
MATDQHDRLPSDLTLADRDYVALCLQAARNEFERSGDTQYVYMIAAYIGKLASIDEQLRPQQIAQLNDKFRRDCLFPSILPSVLYLREPERILEAVQDFEDFDAGNDPYGEHDFGAFNWDRERIFWKIDYVDRETGYWRDPLDPECQRILTIMTSDDY